MTFGILKVFAHDPVLKDSVNLEASGYSHSDYYYEHAANTAGFVFGEDDLETFVRVHGVDPVVSERGTPQNFANYFAFAVTGDGGVIVFEASHKPGVDPVVSDNYFRYEVFERNGDS